MPALTNNKVLSLCGISEALGSIAWFDQQFSKEIIKDKKDLVLSHDGLFHTLLGLWYRHRHY
jgi:hypothetical protein